MKIEKYLKVFRNILIFWTAFIGIGAMGGGIAMLAEPTGKTFGFYALIPYMKNLPIIPDSFFDNFIFPGIMLICVNGITNLTACAFLIAKKKVGYLLGAIFGFTLMLWIVVQFCIFPNNFMSNIYFDFGILQLLTGVCAMIYCKRLEFVFDKDKYENVNKTDKVAVVYFSRNGYTAKIAYELANKRGACVYEITTNERTNATLGFWWCGRFGMHGWGMPINKADEQVFNADKIIIVSPVWVFKMSAPIRQFIIENKEKLANKQIEFAFNHFNPWLPSGAVSELKEMLSVQKVYSYQTMWGIIKEQTNKNN